MLCNGFTRLGEGEEPKLGKQTLSKLNIETKPGEVDEKCKKTELFL